MHARIPGLLIIAAIPALLLANGSRNATTATVRDFDKAEFEKARVIFADPSTSADSRVGQMRELVRRDAVRSKVLLAGALGDPNPEVARKAAEWLAILGDRRGLDVQGQCVETLKCKLPFEAIRFLGIWRDAKYAPAIAEKVRSILDRGTRKDGKWWGSAEDRALLEYGSVALARIGRAEDRELVIKTVGSNPLLIGVEALGYIDDPRSREVLWATQKEWMRRARATTCGTAGLGVPALRALSRLNDSEAIERLKEILRGVGTPPDPWPAGGPPTLCADRQEAFRVRPRDAKNFAETIFEIASQQPEGPGTREAWEALGVMHPEGFGDRMLMLATSKTQWRLVDRQTLFEAVIAVDPDLGIRFWNALKLDVAPAEEGLRTFVKEGVGYLMFSAGAGWTGD